ncbi:S8 family serine peptidase [Paenibacillus beijingensis]|uniref:S8 family serine peptidase n=1 Tax=Paenibacillus beijingensis TaxID=1126833 RepID=UPI0006984709|nr:S8 family serine peptidase [Paenibacillus beijingensis]
MNKKTKKLLLTVLSSVLSGLLVLPSAAGAADASGPGGVKLQTSTRLSIPALSKLAQAHAGLSSIQAAEFDQKPIISPKLRTSSDKPVRVIVQLAGASVSEGKYAAKMGLGALAAESTEAAVQSEQSSFISKAKQLGIDFKVTKQFDTVLNGMEIELPANQIPELSSISGVKSVYENKTYYVLPIEAPASASTSQFTDIEPLEQIGVPQAWAKGLTGKGLKVGVLDTGVDYLHPDLKDAYKGGYNSFYNTDDPYEDVPHDDLGGTDHGTHVSGTIVGRAANQTSDIIQKGVAYEADLYAYKVLGYNAETGRSSGSSAQVIDGIERAVKDGMNVINLSLGSSLEKDPNAPDSIAVNNAVLAGVTVVVASGNAANDGPFYYSMGSPASAQLAISVGAVNSLSRHFEATVKSSFDSNLSYKSNLMGWKTNQEDFKSILGTEPIHAIYAGLGDVADYEGKDANGKVVFLSRGSLSFVDKIAIAKAHGAKAVIIFNGSNKGTEANLADSIPGRDSFIPNGYLGDSPEYIPTFDMEGKPGRALAREVLANPDTPLTFTFGDQYPSSIEQGDRMAAFSSRGPESDENLSIKPDFGAPGVNILSTYPAYGKTNPDASYDEAYARASGTSMATPHVAGLALLLGQQHPEWTPFDIRAALANTSDGISDQSGTPYDVYSQGAGRVNVAKAIETPALLQTVETLTLLSKDMMPFETVNYGDSASFGIMPAGSDAKTVTLQVKNTSSQPVTYKPQIIMHPSVTSDTYGVVTTPDVTDIEASLSGLNADGSIAVSAGSIQTFNLKAAPKGEAQDGIYEGEVLLTSDGLPSLHLPFVVHVGTERPVTGFGVQDIALTSPFISPGGNQADDTFDLSFTLTAEDVNYIEIAVSGLDDEYIGTLSVGYIVDDQGNLQTIPPGRIAVTGLDGSYIDDEVDENNNPVVKHLTNGKYKLEVYAAKLNDDGSIAENPDGSQVLYFASSQFAVTNTPRDKVEAAKAAFKPNVSNTTTVGSPVLTLPVTEGVIYSVYGSSNTQYVGNDGILLERPLRDTGLDVTVQIAAGEEPTVTDNVYVPVTLPGTYSDLIAKVAAAKNDFKPASVNTTTVGEPVLTFPSTEGVIYSVYGSSNTGLIGNDGKLLARPSSNTDVELTVGIASAEKPDVKDSTKTTVTLPAYIPSGGNPPTVPTPPPSVPPAPPAAAPDLALPGLISQGQRQLTLKAVLQTEGKLTKATINDQDLQELLSGSGNSPVALTVTIPLGTGTQAQLNLTASQAAALAAMSKGSSLLLSDTSGALELPVDLLKKVPSGSGLQITITHQSEGLSALTGATAGLTPIGAPITYEVSAVNGAVVTPLQTDGKLSAKKSFVLPKGADLSHAGVLYAANGKLLPVPAVWTANDDGTTTVIIKRGAFATYTAATRSLSFADIGTSWAQDRILSLADKFLINGTSNNSFSPKQAVTRAQFAAMLVRTLGLSSNQAASFTDIASGAWYGADIAAAFEAGLVNGYGDGSFKPNGTISRQEMSVMLAKAAALIDLKPASGGSVHPYGDSGRAGAFAQSSIEFVTQAGLMQGTKVGDVFYFHPQDPTTREAAATVIFALLQQGKLIN